MTVYALSEVIPIDTPVNGDLVPTSHMIRDTVFNKGDRIMYDTRVWEVTQGGDYQKAQVELRDIRETVRPAVG
jgi:hypothetical protein